MPGPDFSQWVLVMMPMLSSLFVANFGAQLAEVVTVVTTFSAAAAPVILPALTPYMTTGQLDISVPFVTSLAAGVFAGVTAAYTSVKRRSFGIKVQGMATGFMITGFTSPMYAGFIRIHLPELVPVMQWTLMGISLVQGHFLSSLYVKYQHMMTSAFSSLLGAYTTLLSAAAIGLPYTEGLGLGDKMRGHPTAADLEDLGAANDGTSYADPMRIARGITGCTTLECYGVMAATTWC